MRSTDKCTHCEYSNCSMGYIYRVAHKSQSVL